MHGIRIGGVVLALGIVASGCADHTRDGAQAANGKICSPLTAQPAGSSETTGADASALDDCMHRWGYRLARSNDRADMVAEAVVAACSPVLQRWNQATLDRPQNGPDTAVSLVTGKTDNTPADRFGMAQSKALFYVVQARAGNCAAP